MQKSLFIFTILIISLQAFTQSPTIGAFSPASGNVGDTILISGTNFSAINSNNIVYLGATKANVISATTQELKVIVPSGSTYQPISVTVNGLVGYSNVPFISTFSGSGPLAKNSFELVKVHTIPNSRNSVVLADIDSDSKTDIIVLNPGKIIILRNATINGQISEQSFLEKVSINFPHNGKINIADFDGDGKLDIAAYTQIDDKGYIFLFKNISTPGGINSNSFMAPIKISVIGEPWEISSGDFNLDGRTDIAYSSSYMSTNTISVLENVGQKNIIDNNSFSSQVDFATGTSPQHIQVSDLDGDYNPDLFSANFLNSTISILRNKSQGSISFSSFEDKFDLPISISNPRFSFQPYDLKIADLDADGKPDLISGNESGRNAISIYRNVSSIGPITASSFTPPINISGLTTISIYVTDINGDSKLDLVTRTQIADTQVYIHRSDAEGISTDMFEEPVTFSSVSAIGDVSGDGAPDFIILNDSNVYVASNILSQRLPFIKNLYPSFRQRGDTIALTGVNFSLNTTDNIVKFNGATAKIVNATSTSLVVIIPANASSGRVTVQVNNKTAVSETDYIVSPSYQSIDFSAITNKVVGEDNFKVHATSSSGLPVYFSATTDKLALSADEVTILNAGKATVTASQSGNEIFEPALSVSQTFCINPKRPSIDVVGSSSESIAVLVSNYSKGNYWYLNGTEIDGMNEQILVVSEPGIYKLRVAVDECYSDFSINKSILITGDIFTQPHESVLVYPNPTESKVFLNFAGFNENMLINVAIYDIVGRRIEYLNVLNRKNLMIDVEKYSEGEYIIIATQDRTVIKSRFLKISAR